jgi:DNA-binding response OmpR family regulator
MQPAMFDTLLIDPDEQRSLFMLRAIKLSVPVRCAQRSNGRDALASFQRARFDAIICRPNLGDIACRSWIRMVRSGKFGYCAVPVIVLCDEVELRELTPMVDEQTTLVADDDPSTLVAALQAIKEGAHKPALLIIEDEIPAAEVAARALEKAYCVELAHTGSTALKLWREKHHPLILLDLMLPDMLGKEVLAAVRAEDPSQVVVVLTAHDAPEHHQELVLAGAADFLSKPLDLHDLPQACANALRAQVCMGNVERSQAQAASVSELSARVRAAHYFIGRGQVARAGAHLRNALYATHAKPPAEDQWAALMAEFDV